MHKIYTEIQQTFSWKKWKGRDHLGRCRRWWEDTIKMEKLDESRLGTSVSECPVIDNYSTEWNFGLIKAENFFTCRKILILNIGSSEEKVMSTGNYLSTFQRRFLLYLQRIFSHYAEHGDNKLLLNVCNYQTTRRHIPGDIKFHGELWEYLASRN
jgi:hypothetical protein